MRQPNIRSRYRFVEQNSLNMLDSLLLKSNISILEGIEHMLYCQEYTRQHYKYLEENFRKLALKKLRLIQ